MSTEHFAVESPYREAYLSGLLRFRELRQANHSLSTRNKENAALQVGSRLHAELIQKQKEAELEEELLTAEIEGLRQAYINIVSKRQYNGEQKCQ